MKILFLLNHYCRNHNFRFEPNEPISVVPNGGIEVETSKESAPLSVDFVRKANFPAETRGCHVCLAEDDARGEGCDDCDCGITLYLS